MPCLWLPLSLATLSTTFGHHHRFNFEQKGNNIFQEGFQNNFKYNTISNSGLHSVKPNEFQWRPNYNFSPDNVLQQAAQPFNQAYKQPLSSIIKPNFPNTPIPANEFLPPFQGKSFKQYQPTLYNQYLPPTAYHHLYLPPTKPTNTYLPQSEPNLVSTEPIITKSFYFISAPDDDENEQPKQKHFVLGRPQKNYRVVFIKAPISENNNLKLTAALAPQEEKTVIYVLSKKENELQVEDVGTERPPAATKPEVFFIKYRTNEEAKAAQKNIQEQYDNIGGTNEFHDIGVAPLTSVIGSLEKTNSNDNNARGYDYMKGPSTTPNADVNAINNFLLPIEPRNQY